MSAPLPLPSLTPLRGFAALLVLIHHLTAHYLPVTGESIARHSALVRNGYLCVDFFFILSGFLLAHLYRDRLFASKERLNYRQFLRARLARIYPLHLAMLLAMLALALAQLGAQIYNQGFDSYLNGDRMRIGHGDIRTLLLNLTLLQSVLTYGTWNGPAWSISAEWFAYVLFPLLLLPARLAPRANAVLCAPIVLLGLGLIERQHGTLDLAGPAGITRCLLECWLGITLHSYFAAGTGIRLWGHRTMLPLAAILSLLVMHYDWFDTIAILPFALTIVSSVVNRGWPARFLNASPWTFLGVISYSIYMTHWVFMSVTAWLWKGITGTDIGGSFGLAGSSAILALTVALVLLISFATYRFIELPLRQAFRGGRIPASRI